MVFRTCDLEEFMARINGRDLVCFGAGSLLSEFCKEFREFSIESKISFIADNNPLLWGTKKCLNGFEIDIKHPDSLLAVSARNMVVLISCAGIYAQEVHNSLDMKTELSETECYYAGFIWACQNNRLAYDANKAPEGFRMNNNPVIPKRIHYCWVGGNPIPEKNRKCIDSWKRFCPDYEIIEWNEKNYDFMQNNYMKEAYEARNWGFVPDYARFDIVYNHGGIYLDTDVEIVKSLDELLYNTAFCGFESLEYVAFGLGFGGVANFHFFKEIRDSYKDVSFVNKDGTLNLVASPVLQTKNLLGYGLKPDGGFQIINGLAVYPVEYFAPLSPSTKELRITSNTYSIHWYDGSWLSEEQHRISKAFAKLFEVAKKNEISNGFFKTKS